MYVGAQNQICFQVRAFVLSVTHIIVIIFMIRSRTKGQQRPSRTLLLHFQSGIPARLSTAGGIGLGTPYDTSVHPRIKASPSSRHFPLTLQNNHDIHEHR